MAYQQAEMIPEDASEQGARLRALENRNAMLTEKLLMINQNFIKSFKKLQENNSLLAKEILDARQEMQKMHEMILHLAKEVSVSAKQDQLKVLEKYIDLWKPLNFTTEETVNKLIQEALSKKK